MGDEKQKNYQTDFSFSFAGLADKVSDAIGSFAEEPQTSYYEAVREGEQSAKVHVAGSLGKLHIHAGDDPRLLARVESRHVGKLNFEVSSSDGGAGKSIKIENQAIKGGLRGLIGGIKQRDLFLDVALTPSVPLSLKLHSGVGESLVDLRSLQISELKYEGGVGPGTLYVPDGDFKAKIEGGVGPAFIHLPAVTANKVSIEGGVGPMQVWVAEDADLTLDIECGVGPMTVNLPAGTPVMIEWNGGLGPFERPAGLVQKNKSVWHTEGYDLADKSVYLKLDGGVGPARVNFVTPDGEALPGEKAKRQSFDA